MLPDKTNSADHFPEQRDSEQQRWVPSRRRHRFLIVTVAACLAGLAGLIWYAYPTLQKQESSLAKLAGIEPAVATLKGKVQAADSRLADLTGNQEDLRRQVDKIGRELRTRMETAGKQASEASAAFVRRAEAELDARMNGLQSRVADLESSRKTDRAQVAAQIANLKSELNQVRGEAGRQAEELQAIRQQAEANVDRTGQQLSRLEESELRDRIDVNRIDGSLAVERIGFEVSRGRSQQLAPGISLGLTGTDVLHRRASGWMWIMPDRRTIWLRNQSVQVPLAFYGIADGKKRELVITQITPTSVAGYVILPKGAAEPVATGAEISEAGS